MNYKREEKKKEEDKKNPLCM